MLITEFPDGIPGELALADQLLAIGAARGDGARAHARFLRLIHRIYLDNAQYEYGKPVPAAVLNGCKLHPHALMRMYEHGAHVLYHTRVHRTHSLQKDDELRLVHAVKTSVPEQQRVEKTADRHNQM
ncbi:hypothetical protein [Caballeronia grimmiae]|uniref:hypothetical protein n=1 Tax=Caballeronia grimmiae TaxID=1071679 RepID=UPI0038BBAF23